MQLEDLTGRIIGCAIEVHRQLGPGLLESAYQQCLEFELTRQGFCYLSEAMVPVTYKGNIIECGFRADLFVENLVVVELKSVDKIHPIFEAQILTYMKLMHVHVGLLINFNVPQLKDGIKRFVLD